MQAGRRLIRHIGDFLCNQSKNAIKYVLSYPNGARMEEKHEICRYAGGNVDDVSKIIS